MRHSVRSVVSDDALTLSIVDVTNPAFTVTITDQDLDAQADEFVRNVSTTREVPAALRAALERSRLGRGVLLSSGTYLSGMGTYLLKLGPTNLWKDADPVDRRLAGSFPALSARIRLQDTARLLADGLIRPLANRLDRALRFVNIGGGPAADSFNSLIILRKEHRELIDRRAITIAVFDVDDRGPAFGARAIAALRRAGGPLHGLTISFSHISYDWSQVRQLVSALTGDSVAGNEISAVSSEGGLFEYGTDEQIVANLDVLDACTVHDTIVVGSVTRPSTAAEALRAAGHHAVRPRSIESFAEVAAEGGWHLDRVIARPLAYHVRLIKT